MQLLKAILVDDELNSLQNLQIKILRKICNHYHGMINPLPPLDVNMEMSEQQQQ